MSITALIVKYLPYCLSGVTIWLNVLAGNKKRSAWVVALCGQFMWSVWVVLSHTWGLLPLNIALWIIYYRNYVKWGQHA